MKAWFLAPLALVLGSCTGSEEFTWRRHVGLVTVTAEPSVKTCRPIQYSYAVAPLQTSVGGKMTMRVGAFGDGGALSMTWSGTGGEIGDAGASEATFTCGVAGPQELTLTATDVSGCKSVERIAVNCW